MKITRHNALAAPKARQAGKEDSRTTGTAARRRIAHEATPGIGPTRQPPVLCSGSPRNSRCASSVHFSRRST